MESASCMLIDDTPPAIGSPKWQLRESHSLSDPKPKIEDEVSESRLHEGSHQHCKRINHKTLG
jgi:hypothetical protein